MAIHYHCRYCGTNLGKIDQTSLNSEQLGFHTLTNEERDEMIQYDSSGDVLVKCICEDCHETFSKNPIHYENDYIIH